MFIQPMDFEWIKLLLPLLHLSVDRCCCWWWWWWGEVFVVTDFMEICLWSLSLRSANTWIELGKQASLAAYSSIYLLLDICLFGGFHLSGKPVLSCIWYHCSTLIFTICCAKRQFNCFQKNRRIQRQQQQYTKTLQQLE